MRRIVDLIGRIPRSVRVGFLVIILAADLAGSVLGGYAVFVANPKARYDDCQETEVQRRQRRQQVYVEKAELKSGKSLKTANEAGLHVKITPELLALAERGWNATLRENAAKDCHAYAGRGL